ncbi:DUF1441 family protein [Dickeya fangzhongdai]|uniref:DUF1441 family protein n=1 Tax=Dickeya fangzhongdai TaxID=1778540 RepID=UPI0023E46784|nr:DUF1441 family protein [Dickeya fangzhongdai]WES90504.1 DUF1441 family protein [Dickeya fangzhongdai]
MTKKTCLEMTISQLADVTGIHRQTIAKRLADIAPKAGSNCKRKIYDLKDALKVIYASNNIEGKSK